MHYIMYLTKGQTERLRKRSYTPTRTAFNKQVGHWINSDTDQMTYYIKKKERNALVLK